MRCVTERGSRNTRTTWKTEEDYPRRSRCGSAGPLRVRARGSHAPNQRPSRLLDLLRFWLIPGSINRRPDSRYGDSEWIPVPSFVSPKSRGGIGPLLHFFRFAPRVGRKIGSGVPRRSPNHNLPLRIFSVLFRPLAIILLLSRDAHQSHIRPILFHLIMFERPKNRIKIATL